MDLLLLAQEHGGGEKTLWDPTIIGLLVVVFAVVLFCGSIYLLLGTNLGARLGFLVAFTALMGFMVLLTFLWVTTQSPLNTLKGRPPAWEATELVANLDEAENSDARTIQEEGEKVSVTEAANVKAAVDETLVAQAEASAEGEAPAEPSEFAIFQEVTEYQTGDTYELGGSNPNLFDFEITHVPKIAAVEYCEVIEPDVPFGVPPPPPECDPSSDKQGYLILERDLGSLRVPPVVAFFMSIVLFGLGLLSLHWREKDEAALARQPTGPVPVPTKA